MLEDLISFGDTFCCTLLTRYFFGKEAAYYSDNLNGGKNYKTIMEISTFDQLSEIIDSDDLDRLIDFVSNPNFDINCKFNYIPHTYSPDGPKYRYILLHDSVYIRKQPSLLEYSALRGSTKCFKYLWINDASHMKDIIHYAVGGGDEDIIKLVCQSGYVVDKKCIECSIIFHQFDAFKWIMEQIHSPEWIFRNEDGWCILKNYNFTETCLIYEFYHGLSFFRGQMSVFKALNHSIFAHDVYLTSYYIEKYHDINEDDDLNLIYHALDMENTHSLNWLLDASGIDVNKTELIEKAACYGGEKFFIIFQRINGSCKSSCLLKAIRNSLKFEIEEVAEAIIKNLDLKIPCYHAECSVSGYEDPCIKENGAISIYIQNKCNRPDLIELILKRKDACLTRADYLTIIENFPSINREIVDNVRIVKVSHKIKINTITTKIEDDFVTEDNRNHIQHKRSLSSIIISQNLQDSCFY